MDWKTLWINLFGTTEMFGLNMGFYVSMFVVCVIVVVMNLVFWSLKPNIKEN